MPSAFRYMSARKSFFFMIIGLLVFVAYLYFFVGFGEVYYIIGNLDRLDYVVFYSLAFAATVTSTLFLSASWRALLKAVSIEAKLKNLFLYTLIGNFVDLVVPSQAVFGEVTRVYLVHKESKENYGAIAASSITNRIISYIISSAGLLVGIILLLTRANTVPPYIMNLLLVALAGTGIYLAVLFYLAIDERAAAKLTVVIFKILTVLRLRSYESGSLPEKTKESLSLFHRGFETFKKRPRSLVQPLIFQVASVFLNISVCALVFYALGFTNLLIDFFIIVYFIVGTIQIAAAVFSVGALDIALTNLFIIYGVPAGFSVLAATSLRVLTFWFPILIGYVTLQAIGARGLLNPRAMEGIAVQKNVQEQPILPSKS